MSGKPGAGRPAFVPRPSPPPRPSVMADNTAKRRSPFGIALLVVGVLTLLLIVFLLSQRGGETTGGVGGGGIDAPEQIEPSETIPD